MPPTLESTVELSTLDFDFTPDPIEKNGRPGGIRTPTQGLGNRVVNEERSDDQSNIAQHA